MAYKPFVKKLEDAGHIELRHELDVVAENGLFVTDTHAHIHFPPLSDEMGLVVKRALENHVGRIVTVGITYEDSINAVAAASKYENVFSVVGVHPHDSKDFDTSSLPDFKNLLSHEKVLGIGEIGLDYYWDNSPRDVQKKVFEDFMHIALEKNMPIIIHNRDATTDTVDMLVSTMGKRKNNGIIHCFSGDKDLMRAALDNGFYLSYAGPVTYSKAEELRETLNFCPLDRIFVETDCPYLTPVPLRGKTNEPANVIFTLAAIAKEKKVHLADAVLQLEKNFNNLFAVVTA